jgi:hypothetical protein
VSRYVRKVEKALGEQVLAAAPVQPGGTLGASAGAAAAIPLAGLLGGIAAVFLGRAHLRSERLATGLPLTPYMLLAVTEDRLYLLEAGHGWGVKSEIASWPRSGVGVDATQGPVVYRMAMYFSDRPEHLRLQAPRGKAIGKVLELLPAGRPDDPLVESDLAG